MREITGVVEGLAMDRPKMSQLPRVEFSDPVGQLLYEQTLHRPDLCDVSIQFAGMEQKVHKCVLMTSEYFHALYESGLMENDKSKVTINVGSPAAIQAAIQFLYLRRTEITLQNVMELMEVADYLQISQMREQCIKFLMEIPVRPDNCVMMCLMGSQYDQEDLYHVGYDYLIAHLQDVLQHEHILSLGVDSILEIISDKSLIYVEAEDLFRFLIRWVEYDLDQRLPHLPELFSYLNLEQFTEESFNKLVCCHVLVNMFPQCRDRLVKFTSQLEAGDAKLNAEEKPVFLMAGHEAQPHVMISNSGRTLETIGTRRLLGFLPWEKRWVELPPMPINFTSPALLTSSNRVIYVAVSQAFRENENNQQFYKYDLLSKKWSDVRALIPYYERNKAFRILSIHHCQGRLYAVTSTQYSISKGHGLSLYLLEEGVVTELVWQKELLTFGVDPEYSKVQVVVVNNRHICVTVDCVLDQEGGQEIVFLLYDLDTCEVTDLSQGAMCLSLLFHRDGEVVLAEPGIGYAKVLSLSTMSWRVEKDLGIPALPESHNRSHFNYFYQDGKLFIFGGRDSEYRHFVKSSLMYNFALRNWVKLGYSPSRIVGSMSGVSVLDSKALRCHIDCPHCKFTGLKQSADYDIQAPAGSGQTSRDSDDEGWESETEDDNDTSDELIIHVQGNPND